MGSNVKTIPVCYVHGWLSHVVVMVDCGVHFRTVKWKWLVSRSSLYVMVRCWEFLYRWKLRKICLRRVIRIGYTHRWSSWCATACLLIPQEVILAIRKRWKCHDLMGYNIIIIFSNAYWWLTKIQTRLIRLYLYQNRRIVSLPYWFRQFEGTRWLWTVEYVRSVWSFFCYPYYLCEFESVFQTVFGNLLKTPIRLVKDHKCSCSL